MAQYEDFTNYSYMKLEDTNTFNIGWLEGRKEINKGEVSQEFLDNLWEYMKCPIHITRGLHCNIDLDEPGSYFKAVYNGCEIKLGNAEIRVIDKQAGCVYAAPNLILHYIISHNYLPPEKFINAVIKGPKPGSEEFAELIRNIYADVQEIGSEKLNCPYCGRKKMSSLPRIKKVYQQDKKIKILNVLKECESSLTDYDYCYPYLCKKCGKIFNIEYSVIASWLKKG